MLMMLNAEGWGQNIDLRAEDGAKILAARPIPEGRGQYYKA